MHTGNIINYNRFETDRICESSQEERQRSRRRIENQLITGVDRLYFIRRISFVRAFHPVARSTIDFIQSADYNGLHGRSTIFGGNYE